MTQCAATAIIYVPAAARRGRRVILITGSLAIIRDTRRTTASVSEAKVKPRSRRWERGDLCCSVVRLRLWRACLICNVLKMGVV